MTRIAINGFGRIGRLAVRAGWESEEHTQAVLSTMVIDGTQAKILAWYDNEWGYAKDGRAR